MHSRDIQNALKRFHLYAPILVALADDARQKIIMDLADAGPEGINVTAITASSALSRPAISHHLKVLKDCGLIKSKKHGTQVFYFLYLDENLENLTGLISSIEVLINKAKQDIKAREGFLTSE